jgi:hypothetical protein
MLVVNIYQLIVSSSKLENGIELTLEAKYLYYIKMAFHCFGLELKPVLWEIKL